MRYIVIFLAGIIIGVLSILLMQNKKKAVTKYKIKKVGQDEVHIDPNDDSNIFE